MTDCGCEDCRFIQSLVPADPSTLGHRCAFCRDLVYRVLLPEDGTVALVSHRGRLACTARPSPV